MLFFLLAITIYKLVFGRAEVGEFGGDTLFNHTKFPEADGTCLVE